MTCTNPGQSAANDLRRTCEPLIDDVFSLVQAARLAAIGLGRVAEDYAVDREESEALVSLLRLAIVKTDELRRLLFPDEV